MDFERAEKGEEKLELSESEREAAVDATVPVTATVCLPDEEAAVEEDIDIDLMKIVAARASGDVLCEDDEEEEAVGAVEADREAKGAGTSRNPGTRPGAYRVAPMAPMTTADSENGNDNASATSTQHDEEYRDSFWNAWKPVARKSVN